MPICFPATELNRCLVEAERSIPTVHKVLNTRELMPVGHTPQQLSEWPQKYPHRGFSRELVSLCMGINRSSPQILRGIIDDRRAAGERSGHYLLLGSAAIDLMRQASESLAGRVAYVNLEPIDALELPHQVGNTDRLWVRGGFPNSVLASNDSASLDWRRDFIRSYLERDVPMFAPRMPAETIGRLWTMLAHAQGTLVNQARLASSLGVSSPAVGRYVDLLVDLLLVRRLRPWVGNVGKRLVRTPKVYIRDSGIAHSLLDIETLVAAILGPKPTA
jgi:uncharacterized protein